MSENSSVNDSYWGVFLDGVRVNSDVTERFATEEEAKMFLEAHRVVTGRSGYETRQVT